MSCVKENVIIQSGNDFIDYKENKIILNDRSKITEFCNLAEFKTLKNESTNGTFDDEMFTGMIGERVSRNFLLNKGFTVYGTNKTNWNEGDIMTVDSKGFRRTFEIKTPSAGKYNLIYMNLIDLWQHFTDNTYNFNTRYPDIVEPGWLWKNTSDYLMVWFGLGKYYHNKERNVMFEDTRDGKKHSDIVNMYTFKNDFRDNHMLANFIRDKLFERYGNNYDFETATKENIDKFNTQEFKTWHYVKDFEVHYCSEGRGKGPDNSNRNKNTPWADKPYIHDDVVIVVNADWLFSEFNKLEGEKNAIRGNFKYNDTLVFGERNEI